MTEPPPKDQLPRLINPVTGSGTGSGTRGPLSLLQELE